MLVSADVSREFEATTSPRVAATLEAFLADVGTRAFRFAEAGLRSRDDALDAVQDAMMKMLAYRERPAAEWTPLFWSILRRKIVDLQRRGNFRLRFMAPASERSEDSLIDWADSAAGPSQAHDQREAFTLRVLEELDVADTARAMGCSEGSVKTHLSRARDALQKQLEDFR